MIAACSSVVGRPIAVNARHVTAVRHLGNVAARRSIAAAPRDGASSLGTSAISPFGKLQLLALGAPLLHFELFLQATVFLDVPAYDLRKDGLSSPDGLLCGLQQRSPDWSHRNHLVQVGIEPLSDRRR